MTWGDQSWEEMMVGFFNLVFDAELPVDKLFVKKPKAEIAREASSNHRRGRTGPKNIETVGRASD